MRPSVRHKKAYMHEASTKGNFAQHSIGKIQVLEAITKTNIQATKWLVTSYF
jgi:hypothetical protein